MKTMTVERELKSLGLENYGDVARDLTSPQLYEEIIKNREGRLGHLGSVIVRTGHFAERTARDTFIVSRPEVEGYRWVAGNVRTMESDAFDQLMDRVRTYLHNRDIYVQDVVARLGKRPVSLRVITETAWHSLFARTLYWPRAQASGLVSESRASFTILQVPRFQAIPERDGTNASSFVAMDFGPRQLIVIGGTAYAGEIRQAVASICRYLDDRNASDGGLPLRCAVNVGPEGDVAAFFGRTGNGKTSLAAELSEERRFIGDHEHRWDEAGLVSVERGCYARALELTAESSPVLHHCTRRFGSILENVILDQNVRRVDLADARLTTNTRVVFPNSHLPRFEPKGTCPPPKHLFLLTRDTLGVLPPIARLTHDQAVFAFLTSYVSSLAETEATPGDVRPSVQYGLGSGPNAHAIRPEEYARRFLAAIQRANVRCWFMNTGWVGEPVERGDRLDLQVSRRLVAAALAGELDDVRYEADPLFQFEVPTSCPGVESGLLNPREGAADQGEYEMRANRLALDFIKGFERFEVDMPESVREMVAAVPILDTDFDLMEQVGFAF